jgi:hypothetical protein
LPLCKPAPLAVVVLLLQLVLQALVLLLLRALQSSAM